MQVWLGIKIDSAGLVLCKNMRVRCCGIFRKRRCSKAFVVAAKNLLGKLAQPQRRSSACNYIGGRAARGARMGTCRFDGLEAA